MALTELFNDRKARKFVKESIYEAAEIGKGFCSFCGHSESLLQAFEGMSLCSECATRLVEKTEDYDRVFDSVPDAGAVLDMLSEDYVYLNTSKLEADAVSKFNGSVPDLIRSYGIKLKPGKSGWNDQYHKGMVWIDASDIKKAGSSGLKLNQFLSDYSAMAGGKKIPTIAADSDGTSYTLQPADSSFKSQAAAGVKNSQFTQPNYIESGSGKASSPSTPSAKVSAPPSPSKPKQVSATPAAAPAQAAQTTQNVKITKGKFSIQGSWQAWAVTLGKTGKVEINALGTNNNGKYTYDAELKVGNRKVSQANFVISYNGDAQSADGLQKIVELVLQEVAKAPGTLIPSFEGEGTTFSINKYGVYEFAFDEYTLQSNKEISLAVVYNNKVMSSKRVVLSDDALSSRVSLNTQLTAYMDDLISKKYPVLFSKDSIIQTSMGKVNFTFQGFNDKNQPIVSALIGKGGELTGPVSNEDALKDKASARETLLSFLLAGMNKIIPGFYDTTINKKGDNSFELEVAGVGKQGMTVWANFDSNDFVNNGNVSFKVSVMDDFSGVEMPKTQVTYIYRKPGVPIQAFLTDIGRRLYKEQFTASSMVDVMTTSARDKMKNPGKKQALFDKIAGLLVRKFPEISALRDCEVEASIEVNKDGKVISGEFTIRDPYNDISSNSRDLASKLSIEKSIKFLKFRKAHPEAKDGPAVTYTVTDMEEFSKALQLNILEHLIFEAFGITPLNEGSKRKTISV